MQLRHVGSATSWLRRRPGRARHGEGGAPENAAGAARGGRFRPACAGIADGAGRDGAGARIRSRWDAAGSASRDAD